MTSSFKRRNCDTSLSVGIATPFYRRRYSDGFGRDGKNLGKFPTFGQKHRKQVSEFPPNVVVTNSPKPKDKVLPGDTLAPYWSNFSEAYDDFENQVEVRSG